MFRSRRRRIRASLLSQLPPDLLRLAQAHRRRQQELARKATRLARRLWARVDPRDALGSWRSLAAAEVLQVLTLAQLNAADGANSYVAAALATQGEDGPPDGLVDPNALAGIASDGRPLGSLLEQPASEVSALVVDGLPVDAAGAAGARHLARIVATQVADAARVATGVGTVASRAHGYVRMLTPPSCSRCVVLAGKFYATNTGFQRHPLCDCVHIPARESLHDAVTSPRAYFDSLDAAEQDRVFTVAGAQAIRDGADVGQVVNARRGGITTAAGQPYGRRLRRTDVFGRQMFTTTAGAGRGAPRLMPESIYEIAENREDAIRLLRRFGYLL